MTVLKFFAFGALISGYCVAQGIANCAQPEANFLGVEVCYVCDLGFFVADAESTACAACEESCARCQNITGDNCYECLPGNVRNPIEGACIPCEGDCLFCSIVDHTPNLQWCYECAEGFFTDGNGFCLPDSEQGILPEGCVQGVPGRCDVCEPGFYPADFGRSCDACAVEGCASCNDSLGEECFECLPGFLRNPVDGACIACEANCIFCQEAAHTANGQWCYECGEGFFTGGNGQCLDVSQSGVLAEGCVQGLPGRCDVCEPGLFPANFGLECAPCADAGCADCKGQEGTECTQCLPGHIRNPVGVDQACVACTVPNCTYCDPNQWCYQCGEGTVQNGMGGCV